MSDAVLPPGHQSRSGSGGLTRRSFVQGGAALGLLTATGLIGRASAQTKTLPLAGLNLSGLASNNYVENARIGTHYRDITEQHIAAAGACPLFRLPTTAQRFSTGQGGPLNPGYVKQVEDVLNRVAAAGKLAILELHDYMRLPHRVATKSGYRRDGAGRLVGPDGRLVTDPADDAIWQDTYRKGAFLYQGYFDGADDLLKLYEYRVIGTPGCKLYNDAGLPDLWARIVSRFRSHPAIFGWGLMNEPYQGPEKLADGRDLDMAAHWLKTATNTTARIFSRDTQHYVFICGNQFASARLWPELSDALGDIPDPYGRIVYEAHNYLDNDGTGGGAWKDRNEVVKPETGIWMTEPFVEWLRQRRKRGYLGEHGYPEGNQSAQEATRRMLAYLQENNVPSTQWCFGPGWPADDVLGMSRDIDAKSIQVKGNMAAVEPFFKARLADYIPPI
ncbi:glycoside hydrolase family 5 protein [Pseudoxanthomonas composti]|uniref:glycoside hydrolase family 5 protein n=1 Tax=Pseudoxanthomonas composti TaxID=2137479 RepID=UPI001F5146CF|nr:cellulase family glycosylhydrolase [Pseudoxanthomonas composti]